MNKKYFIVTYGCQMNESDSERIASVLEDIGYSPTPDESEADLLVINVCSVRQRAIDRIFGKINKIKNKRLKVKVILTGCILEKDKEQFENQVDEIWPIVDLEIKPKYQSSYQVFVPIMTGCDNFCSYCVVPYVRGREYSRPAEEIIDEVRGLVERGYKEVTLLGQNVNSYSCNMKHGTWNKINFPKLLRMVNDIEGDFWLRFVTSHPKDMSDELIEMVARCNKVCEYIHLPVQSGDDKILENMNRGYTVKQYLTLVEKIRKTFAKIRGKFVPISITTDAIVGFPGETKKQFENTVKLFKKVGFDMAYIAQYSPRAGTAAAKLKDNVPHEEKKRRKEVLTEILRKTALENNRRYVGRTIKVLVDESRIKNQESGLLLGKMRSFKNVKFESDKNLIGKFVKVKITSATPWGLSGRLLAT